jgi:L-lysine 2,3-aminomutase
LIPLTNTEDKNDWQSQLRAAVTSGNQLLALLGLQPQDTGYAVSASADFALKVPQSFVNRMRHGDPNDPLLRQVLSHGDELLSVAGYGTDPVGETGAAITHPGIIQKYRGRALLILSGGCAINCRYCFRRHFPYNENRNSRREWTEALEHIAADSTITEVILSGGDPLLVADADLQRLVDQLADIPHLKRLRVHSRMPIVLPARVTEELLATLTSSHLQAVMVVHSNHGNEIDGEVATGFRQMLDRNIPVLNQAVLLAGVNNDVDSLSELSEKLFAAGALPYYLHLLDKVQGAAHFDVSAERGLELISALENQLPGYLVPRLVREVAGEPAKVRLRG